MGKYKLKCEVVQDLFPSYVERLTSEVTNKEIEEHLAECEECRNMLKRMREPEKTDDDTVLQKKEIDFLKTMRMQTRKKIFISVFVIVILIVAGILIKFYCIGNSVSPEAILCNVTKSDDTLMIRGSLIDSTLEISELDIEEKAGILIVNVKAAQASPFSKETFEYATKNTITQVRIGERIVWDQGKNISKHISAVYNTKHPYIGDMPANNETVMALKMKDVLGNFTHELNSYEWKMILEETVPYGKEAAIEEKMKSYAYVLLAVIDNLECVTYDYKTEDGEKTLSIDVDDAYVFAGKNIKECALSPADLQELMERAELDLAFTFVNVDKNVYLRIVYETKEEIDGMIFRFEKDGTVFEVRSVTEFSVTLPSMEWNPETEECPQVFIEVYVKTKDGSVHQVKNPINLSYDWGRTHEYKLSGSAEEGFRLEQ